LASRFRIATGKKWSRRTEIVEQLAIELVSFEIE
jgi:hypothetical protein